MRKRYKDYESIKPMLANFGLQHPSVGENIVTITNGDGQYVVGQDRDGYYVAWRPFAERAEELRSAHEALRAEIIARDGAIDPLRVYPELDALSQELVAIMMRGEKSVAVTAEEVERAACAK